MIAPVADVAARFSAQGAEVVQRTLDRVAQKAAEAAAKVAEQQIVNAQLYRRTVAEAERAAYAEQALRDRTAAAAAASANRAAEAEIAARRRVAAEATRAAAATQASVSQRYGMMALSVSSALNQMSFIGKATGEGLRNIMIQTGLVATQILGKGGPWGAAISVGLLTLTTLFQRARAEQRQLEEEWRDSLDRMINAGDWVGAKDKLKELWEGTAAQEFRDGLGGRLQRLGLPLAELPALERALQVADLAARTRQAGAKERAEEIRQVIELRRRYDELAASILNPANAQRFGRPAAPIQVTGGRPGDPGILTGPPARTRWDRGVFGALDARLDRDLAGATQIRPLGDPEQFQRTLNEDLARTIAGIKIPPLPIPAQWQQDFATAVSTAIVGGFAIGIEQAVASGSFSIGFKGLSSALLSGLGSAMIEFGQAALMASTLMAKVKAALASLNPAAGLAASLALIAAGATLRGVASRAFGGMGGGRSGGGGFSGVGNWGGAASSESVTRLVFGTNSVATAAGMTPRGATNITVIGPGDPVAQRQIIELIRAAERRG